MKKGVEQSPPIAGGSGMELAGSLPLFPGIPGSRLDASLPLADFQQKRLLFNRFDTPGQIHVYSAVCMAGERLRVQMLTPVLPGGGAVSPSFAVVAQSLPYSADVERLPLSVPAGFSAIVALAPSKLTAPFQDLLTGTRYYAGPVIDTRPLVAGRCYVVVWSPQNQMGKYVLQIGSSWPWRWSYWVRLPHFWWQMRGWFGQTRRAAYGVGAGLLFSALLLLWLGRLGRQGSGEEPFPVE